MNSRNEDIIQGYIKDKCLILQRSEWLLPPDPSWELVFLRNKFKIQSVSVLMFAIVKF